MPPVDIWVSDLGDLMNTGTNHGLFAVSINCLTAAIVTDYEQVSVDVSRVGIIARH